MSRGRRLAFTAALVAVVLVSVEALSFVGLLTLEWLRPGSTIELGTWRHFRFLVTEKRLASAAKSHDPVIGWVPLPFAQKEKKNSAGDPWTLTRDAWGGRKDPTGYDTLIAATYGDSFTHGHEVSDDQTWQHFAAQDLGSAIWNFGVGGYSTLQAVLRTERNLEKGWVTPVTVLGIYSNNLGRTLMAFRPFLYPGDSMKLAFMPTLRLEGGAIREYPVPWRDPDSSREELRRIAVEAADHDYWAQHRLRVSFPFSLSVARGLLSPPGSGPNTGSLWKSKEGRAVMDHLADRFLRAVEEAGSIPVFLFLPHQSALERERPASYAPFVAALRKRRPDVKVLDANESEFDRSRFNVRPFRGHASEYGNRVVAEIVAKAIAELGVEPIPVPEPPASEGGADSAAEPAGGPARR